MPDFRIFLSTVSSEFRSYRDALRQPLTRPNISVKVQEDFIAAGAGTLDKLDDYLRHCDAVVHLVGDMTGSFAKGPALESIRARYPDLGTRLPALGEALQQGQPMSYTQWEAYLAIYHGKKLLIAAPRPGAPRDPGFVSDEAQRALQRLHVERLRKLGRYIEIEFDNADKLTIEVLRSPIFDMLHATQGDRSIVSEHAARQRDLIRRHELFGGRQVALDRLDALVQESERVFHFVHAPSGFGKTALLANWIRVLWARGQAVVYQFVNRLEGMADEHFALRNLCEQLAAWHGIVDPLPASVDDLRNVYVRLVQRQSLDGQKLVIVLDGLDEATGWQPRQLLPASLGCGVHVVFSVRADSEESRNQWLARLGLTRERVDLLELGRLDEPAIGDLLRKAGSTAAALATDAGFVRAIHEVSRGDPFYLHFLVKDIESGNLTRDTVSNQPGDLWAYLDQWLSQLHEDVDTSREEVYALIGFLSAALGPLKSAELAGASPILKKGMLLERELSGNLRRYLSGGRSTGYALCHPRFRDYLCSNVFNEEELAGYRGQLLAYCRKWREHRSSYALDHYVAHLVEEGNAEELYALICADWKDARMAQTGSARAFAADVEAAIGVASRETAPNVPETVRCTLVYATIASFVRRMPVEALGAMARAGLPGAAGKGAGAAAARDYAALIRDPEPRAHAYCTIGLAAEAEGWRAEAVDMWALALVTAERIRDAKARASALLNIAEAIQRVGGAEDLLAKTAAALEATTVELTDAGTFDGIARVLEAAGEAQKAAEYRQRAQTARENEKGGLSFDMSGPAFAKLFEGFNFGASDGKDKTLDEELDAHIAEADALLKDGRRDDALAALAKAERLLLGSEGETADGTGSRDGPWLRLAEALGRAGERQRAEHCAMRAIAAVHASTDAGSSFVGTTKAQRLLRIADTLAGIGCGERAEAAARAAAACDAGELAHVLAGMARLALRLCSLQRLEGARFLVGCIVRVAQAVSAPGARAQTLAVLALAAARRGHPQAALELADLAMSTWNGAGEFPLNDAKVVALGNLARARALSDPLSRLERERELSNQLSGLSKAKALALLAVSLGDTGAKDAAVACVNELIPLLGPPDGIFARERAEIVLEAARAMIACGDRAWALRNIEPLLSLTSGSGTLTTQARLVAGIASVQAEAGDRDNAFKHGMAALERAVGYATGFIQDRLVAVTGLLCALGETGRAHELVTFACAAIETMDMSRHDLLWAFPEVALAAGTSGCDAALERLQAIDRLSQEISSSCACLSSLSLAFAARGRHEPAQAFAARALEVGLQMLQTSRNAYMMARPLPQLAEALERTGNQPALERLCEAVLALEPHRQEPLLRGLVPVLGRVSGKAALKRIADAAAEMEPAARSRTLAVVASAYSAHDLSVAREVAQAALAAFEEERDGAVTPDVLPLLVPALVAVEDSAGLLRLLRMPAAKRPYEREWGPGLRLLLPALARLGIEDPDPGAREALARVPRHFAAAQIDIAEAQALHGFFDKAVATAGSLSPPQRRAEAFIRITKVFADRGENGRAAESLASAAANLPVLHNDVIALGEMALAAKRLDAAPRMRRELEQAFLRATRVNLVSIDVDVFARAVVPVASSADEHTLRRVAWIVDACGDPVQRARSGAALLLALVQAGRFADFELRHQHTMQSIGELDDIAERARPLCDLARALALRGHAGPARDAVLQALNAARHSGRWAFLEILEDGAEVLFDSDALALQIAGTLERVDALFSGATGPGAGVAV